MSDGGNVLGYDFDTARITYQISGTGEGSSEVLIKGDKKVIKTDVIMRREGQPDKPVSSYVIQDKANVYTLNKDEMKGTLIENPLYNELKKLSPDEVKKRLIKEAVRGSVEEGQEPTPVGQEEIAGQTCDVYEYGYTKSCLWQSIPLKTVVSLPEYDIETTTLATNVELNGDISDAEFEPPQEYQIIEIN